MKIAGNTKLATVENCAAYFSPNSLTFKLDTVRRRRLNMTLSAFIFQISGGQKGNCEQLDFP